MKKINKLLVSLLVTFGILMSCKGTMKKEATCHETKVNDISIIVEFQIPEYVRTLSNNNTNPLFVRVIEIATERWKTQDSISFIMLFNDAWNEIAPDCRLSEIFCTYELRNVITPKSLNYEVINAISDIIENERILTMHVLKNRIDRLGCIGLDVNPIYFNNSDKYLFHISGVEDTARLCKLLKTTGNLEFWETFNCRTEGITYFIVDADKKIKELNDVEKAKTKKIANKTNEPNQPQIDETNTSQNLHPLLSLLNLNIDTDKYGSQSKISCVGRAHGCDTAEINKMLALPQILAMKPNNLRFAWTYKPVEQDNDFVYELIALKLNSRFGNEAPLTGSVILDARTEFNEINKAPSIDIALNNEGSKIFANLTRNNINKEIAIVFDGCVYVYPKVLGEITSGRVSIAGDFTMQEADDLVYILQSGKLGIMVNVSVITN